MQGDGLDKVERWWRWCFVWNEDWYKMLYTLSNNAKDWHSLWVAQLVLKVSTRHWPVSTCSSRGVHAETGHDHGASNS